MHACMHVLKDLDPLDFVLGARIEGTALHMLKNAWMKLLKPLGYFVMLKIITLQCAPQIFKPYNLRLKLIAERLDKGVYCTTISPRTQ